MLGSISRWMLLATFSSASVFWARLDHRAVEKISQ